jgi:hypothetical protein
MTNKLFKSKLAIFFSGIYLFIAIVLIVGMAFSPPRHDAELTPILLTMPWSGFLLWSEFYPRAKHVYGVSPGLLQAFLALFYVFSVLLNAALLYVIGFSLSRLGKWVEDKNMKNRAKDAEKS